MKACPSTSRCSSIKSHIGLGDFASLLALLKPYRRIFLWGEMGSGKKREGAELLIAFTQALYVDAILVLCKGSDIPLMDELDALSLPILAVDAATAAVNPSKKEKARWRTRLWNDFLRQARDELCAKAGKVQVIGTE